MADITSKTAMAPVTPKAAATDKQGAGHEACIGFSSLPSSIHHGLSEKLQGITEKLHQLSQKSGSVEGATGDPAALRSRTSSWGTAAHPNLAVQSREPAAQVAASASCQSPSRTCSRTSSKKSDQSTLISNGKVTEGNPKNAEKFSKQSHWGHEISKQSWETHILCNTTSGNEVLQRVLTCVYIYPVCSL